MTYTDIMRELETLGTAQNRKVYARHGAPENQFGVPYADLYKLQKKIKVDHEAALALWATGNADARIFATLIADPSRIEADLLDKWVSDCTYYIIADAVSRYLACKVPYARRSAERWIESDHEWTSTCGWTVLAVLSAESPDTGGLPDDYFQPLLARIVTSIHSAPNRTKYAMNVALCSFGIYREGLRDEAFKVAAAIGKVEVDHGQTGCKTPDAASYIMNAVSRRSRKRA